MGFGDQKFDEVGSKIIGPTKFPMTDPCMLYIYISTGWWF